MAPQTGPERVKVNGTGAGNEEALASALESILFVAGEPVSIRSLARLTGSDAPTVRRAAERLMTILSDRGIRLQVHDGRLQLITSPDNAALVRQFLSVPRQPQLSRPALETVAIVAYRQPVTKAEIEEIRGVGVDRMLSNLVARGIVVETGRRERPGRPIEYGTTRDFLQMFGLSSLRELPALESPLEVQRQTSFTLLGMNTTEAGEASPAGAPESRSSD